MRRIKIFAVALLCFAVVGGSLFAQKTKGQIMGTVVDDEGTPLPGVTVEATSPRMIGKATGITNENGAFRLLAVSPGTYEITFSLPGFRPVIRRDIVVQVEQTITFAITMTPGTLEEEITVIGMTPLVDVKSTAKGMTITRELFQLLPKGRNFDSLVTTVPGVYDDEDLLSGISVDGASGAENMFYIDGIDTTNLVTGESGQDVSIDFAEEIQFKASGYNAEYGGSVGGVIHVITRSGGNEFHGELLGYYSGSALEGTRRKALDFDFDDYTKAKYYSYDEYYGQTDDYTMEGGFNLGGYVIRDRLWFFGSFMPKYFKRVRTVDYAIQDLDDVIDYTRTEQWWNFSAKLTAQPLRNLRMGASFVNNFYKYKGDNVAAYNGNPGTDYEQYGFSYPNYTASAYADLTLGSSGLLSVRGGYWYYNQTDQAAPVESGPYYGFRMEQPFSYARVENSMFPEIPAELQHPAGWQNYPRNSLMALNKYIRNRITINADLSYYLTAGGEHAFKAGIQFMRRGEDQDNTAQQPIVYLAWDEEFTAYGVEYGRGKYGWYGIRGNDDAGPYGNFYTVKMNSWAIYAQDSWTIADRLTLNFGIRAESEYIPSYTTDPIFADIDKPVNFPFSKKIAPRLGFIYDVFGDQTFKIFGSFGIYHDVMKLYMGANALGGFKWSSAYYTLDDYDYTKIGVNNNYPGTLLKVLDFRPPVFDSIDSDMSPFTQREFSFGAERQLVENVALSVRVVNKSVLNAIEDCGIVLPEGEFYYYCNPGGDFINGKYQEARETGFLEPGTPDMPDAKRVYWGVNFALDKRFSNNWIGGLSYTWSKLTGNFTGLASGDELGRNSPNGERYFDIWHLSFDKNLDPIDGPLPTDRPHAFKAYGSYVFPFGLTLGAIVNAMSGVPTSEEWNVDTPGYYPFNRNSMGRTPFLWFVNAYTEYNLRFGDKYNINFNVNVDNVFNTDTAQWIYRKYYRYNVSPGDAVLLTKNWNPAADETLDPQYKMEYNFYNPISVRLGIKFMF
jgi:hypothetical protein